MTIAHRAVLPANLMSAFRLMRTSSFSLTGRLTQGIGAMPLPARSAGGAAPGRPIDANNLPCPHALQEVALRDPFRAANRAGDKERAAMTFVDP